MDKLIPKIQFDNKQSPNIEILSFAQLIDKLNKAKLHDPFKAHKIEFHLILIGTKSSFKHFVDFKLYELQRFKSRCM